MKFSNGFKSINFFNFFFLNLRSPDVTFVLQIKREKLNALQSNKYKTLSKNLLKKPSEKKKKEAYRK